MLRAARRIAAVLLLGAATLVACRKVYPPEPSQGGAVCPQTPVPWPSLADSPWPMHHHDPQSTGRATTRGPAKGKMAWELPTGGPVATSVVVGPDSTLYFVTAYDSSDGECPVLLYAVSWEGGLKWKFPLQREGSHASPDHGCSPLVRADGTIYVGSRDGLFYAVNANGTLKWTFDTGSDIYCSTAGIGRDGAVYFVAGDHVLYALDPSGGLMWSSHALRFDPGPGLSISPDGETLYVAFLAGAAADTAGVAALTAQGEVKWKRYTGSVLSTPLVDNQGNVYISAGRGKGSAEAPRTGIYCLSPEGKVRWTAHLAYTTELEMALDERGNLYAFAGRSGTEWVLLSFDCEGKIRWELPAAWAANPVASLIVVPPGAVFALSRASGVGNATLRSISQDGTSESLLESDPPRGTSPAIAWGRMVYGSWFAPGGDKVYSIE